MGNGEAGSLMQTGPEETLQNRYRVRPIPGIHTDTDTDTRYRYIGIGMGTHIGNGIGIVIGMTS